MACAGTARPDRPGSGDVGGERVAARRLVLVAAVVLTAVGSGALALTPRPAWAAAPPAAATGCYRWGRSLHAGMSGTDVAQLQLRVAGWAANRGYLAVDGVFGPQTQAGRWRQQQPAPVRHGR